MVTTVSMAKIVNVDWCSWIWLFYKIFENYWEIIL